MKIQGYRDFSVHIKCVPVRTHGCAGAVLTFVYIGDVCTLQSIYEFRSKSIHVTWVCDLNIHIRFCLFLLSSHLLPSLEVEAGGITATIKVPVLALTLKLLSSPSPCHSLSEKPVLIINE